MNEFALWGILSFMLICTTSWSPATAKEAAFLSMAPTSEYLMPRKAEAALARSAAPPSISAGATVMVLDRSGYTTVATGKNGFLCLVERSWGNATTDPEFWNHKVRGPICFNPEAAKTFAPIYLLKTKLVLTGKDKEEIAKALALAFQKKELPALGPGAMCYMMSKQQYLGDNPVTARRWHPHLMFFVSGNAGSDWGGNLLSSPVIAENDPEEHATIFMIWVDHWSDGAPASRTPHPPHAQRSLTHQESAHKG